MEHATKTTTMTNPLMNAKLMAQVTGVAVLLVALLGLFMDDLFGAGFIEFDTTHTVLHFVLAAVALAVGFAPFAQGYAVMYAKVFGAVYLLLGVVGFFWPADGVAGLGLELGENLIHLVIGGWGLLAGFMGGS